MYINQYTKEVRRHFLSPKHVGEITKKDLKKGEILAVGEKGNVQCGDIMRVYLKIKDDKIIDAKFKTYGCVAAIGSSDVLCDIVKGKTIKEALKLNRSDIINVLKKLPPLKLHCSVLGIETLKEAIKDYYKKYGQRGQPYT